MLVRHCRLLIPHSRTFLWFYHESIWFVLNAYLPLPCPFTGSISSSSNSFDKNFDALESFSLIIDTTSLLPKYWLVANILYRASAWSIVFVDVSFNLLAIDSEISISTFVSSMSTFECLLLYWQHSSSHSFLHACTPLHAYTFRVKNKNCSNESL